MLLSSFFRCSVLLSAGSMLLSSAYARDMVVHQSKNMAGGGTLIGYDKVLFDGTEKDSGSSALSVQGKMTVTKAKEVSFINNTMKGNEAGGAAIHHHSEEPLLFSHNGDITVSGNKVICGKSATAGAILQEGGGGLLLHNNGNITFSGNQTESETGSVAGAAFSVRNRTEFLGNGDITISDNIGRGKSARPACCTIAGGPSNGALTQTLIAGNGKVSVTNNKCIAPEAASGSGLFSVNSHLVIAHNDDVVFRGNACSHQEKWDLRGLTNIGQADISADEGKSVTIYDGLYAFGFLNLNKDYTDTDGTVHPGKGDIIFTAETTEQDLEAAKGSPATEEELLQARTFLVKRNPMGLHNGRLILRSGAVLQCDGFFTAKGSGATLRMENAAIEGNGATVNIEQGTGLELTGANTLSAGKLNLQDGATLVFRRSDKEKKSTAPALELNGELQTAGLTVDVSDYAKQKKGKVALIQLAAEELYDTAAWTPGKIRVIGASFNNLKWQEGTLYYTASTKAAKPEKRDKKAKKKA